MKKNNLISNIKLFFKKIQKDFFSSSSNPIEKIIFNTVIITLFISILLTMGFTRIFPLNIFLKVSLLVTNILIILYLLLFSKIKIDRFAIIIVIGFCWFLLTAFLNGTIVRDTPLLLNVLNMIPLYLFMFSSNAAKKTTLAGVISGLIAYTVSFVIYYARDFLSLDLSIRLGGFFGNQNDVAFTLVMATMVFMFYVFKKKYAFIPLVLMSFISLFSTGSRAGLLVAFLVSFIMFVFMFYKSNKKLVVGGTVVLVVFVTTLFFLPMMKPLVDRIIDLFKTLLLGNSAGVNKDFSTIERTQVLINAIQLFLFSPLFGSSFTTLSFSENRLVAHNAYAELLMSQGIVSFLLFLLLFSYPIIKAKKDKRIDMTMYVFVIVGAMVFLFTLSGLHFKEIYIILTLAVASLNEKDFVEISIPKETAFLLIRKKALFLSQANIEDFKTKILESKKQLVVVDSSLKEEYKNIYNSLDGEEFSFYTIANNENSKSIESEIVGCNSLDFNREESIDIIKAFGKSSAKILMFADREKFKNEFLSLKFYEKLFGKRIKSIVYQNADVSNYPLKLLRKKECYNNKIIKHSENNGFSYSKIIPSILFPVLFTFLSVISFSFAITSALLWQKIVFSLFCLVYIGLSIRINYKESKSSQDVREDLFAFIAVLLCNILLTLLFSEFGVIKEKNLTWFFLFTTGVLKGVISILSANFLTNKRW